MQVTIKTDDARIASKVTNDRFGKFISAEWKRLIDPYTPRDTGTLEQSARIEPFRLHYIQKYARAVYYGYNMNFQKKNPYSTYEWDIKAAQSGQLNKLYRTVNSALRSGRI